MSILRYRSDEKGVVEATGLLPGDYQFELAHPTMVPVAKSEVARKGILSIPSPDERMTLAEVLASVVDFPDAAPVHYRAFPSERRLAESVGRRAMARVQRRLELDHRDAVITTWLAQEPARPPSVRYEFLFPDGEFIERQLSTQSVAELTPVAIEIARGQSATLEVNVVDGAGRACRALPVAIHLLDAEKGEAPHAPVVSVGAGDRIGLPPGRVRVETAMMIGSIPAVELELVRGEHHVATLTSDVPMTSCAPTLEPDTSTDGHS